MIKANEAAVVMTGSAPVLMLETMAVLASCYKMLIEKLGEEKANEAFAMIGKDAVEMTKKSGLIDVIRGEL